MKIVVFLIEGGTSREITKMFIRAIKKCSIDILVIDTAQFNPEHIKNIYDFSPDFAITYGFNCHNFMLENKFFFRKAKIPLVCLYYDNPFFYFTDEIVAELRNYPDYYFNFIFDDYLLGLFKNEGFKNGYKILLAADLEIFAPFENVAMENSCCFAGFLLKKTIDLTHSTSLIERFICKVIELKAQFIEIPTLVICIQLFQTPEFLDVYELYRYNSSVFWMKIYRKIHTEGSDYLRKCIISSINDTTIHLYSHYRIMKPNIIFHYSVPYGKDLSAAYQKSAINVNISSLQLETSVNSRVFDVFASKAFVLSDYKKDMEEIFKGYWQKITYKNTEELNDKIEYYLTHPVERNEIVVEAYQDILRSHSYEHRVKYIVDTVNRFK